VTSFGNGTNNQGQVGKNKLYRNNGNGTFTDVAVQAGVNVTGTTISSGYGCSFGDYDLDGDLDLCATAWYAPAVANRLFKNNGDGTFTNVSGTAVVFPANTWGFQSRFADMDHDGWPDLLVSADFGTSRYYVNNGNGTFADMTVASGTGLDQNGMGQTIGDVDNDGDLDWYVTSIFLDLQQPNSGEGNKLYRNDGNHQYTEVSAAAKVDNGGWGWGTVAVDLDHDTLLDLVEVNGRPANAEFTGEQEYVFQNLGDGNFAESALFCGLTYQAEGKSLAQIDYDRDGDMDLAITFNGGLAKLYRNDSTTGAWLHLALDTTNNKLLAPHGFGARVTATVGRDTYLRYMDGGPAFLNTSEWALHFGLGSATVIDELRIEWPRGYVTTLNGVAINQHVVIASPVLGDLDADGNVGSSDLAVLLGSWGTVPTAFGLRADQDGDGVVGSADLALLLGQWTQ
jgi:enediyne biosynthesis protein E4